MKHLIKTLVFIILSTTAVSSEETTPLINEIMSSNASTIQDEDGDYSDWIEIYNPGDSPIDLAEYGLSDRADDPFKWVFPEFTLDAGKHLLVFASGKNRTDIPNHWETVINQGDEWKYFNGIYEPPEDWRSPEFDDTDWDSGHSGFGFGDDDDETVVRQTVSFYTSLYIRKKFNIEDAANITQGILHIDYDDAFVAYINGTEIARANISGNVGTPPPNNQKAVEYKEAKMYTGGNPEMFSIENVESLLVTGENVLAIQVHNRQSFDNDMTAIPFLTFGMSTPPANPGGLLEILKLSLSKNLHTNFKINVTGEILVLVDKTGTIIDQVDAIQLKPDISWGRVADGGAGWVFFEQPAPGESNSFPGFLGHAGPVQASIPGGFYDSNVSVELTVDSPSDEIRYTLDGSAPQNSSTLYTTSIPVESTTVLKARAFDAGSFPGSIVTHTYFINESNTLPVISLSTNPANFFDGDIGIYVEGNQYSPNVRWSGGANFIEDWERPVHMEFYEPDGSLAFNVNAGIKIYGYFTRVKPQKPFRIFLRREYGDTKIKYQIFPDLPVTEFNRLDLRNGGDDTPNTHFEDGLAQSLVKDTNADIQAYRPCIVYINGDYWGIYNIRERLDEDYAASHHGIDTDNIDYIQFLHHTTGIEVVRGNSTHYSAMRDYMENHDLSVPANYDYIETQMDVNNFIDFNITEIYSANSNYLIDTDRIWRPGTPDGKWRWMLSDLDAGFPFTGEVSQGIKYDYTYDAFTNPLESTNFSMSWRALELRNLLENSDFKHEFINRFADYLNTIFSSDTVVHRINEIKALLEPEMPAHIEKWEGLNYLGRINYFIGSTMFDWYENVDGIIDFAENRPEHVRSHIMEHFNLSGTANVDLDISQSGGGKIKINSLVIEDYPWNGIYFKDVPIQVTALPDLGYRFIGWTGVTPEDSPSLEITLTDNISVAAVFEKIGDDIVLDRYHSPYEIKTDQVISAGKTLTVGPGVELIMSENANIYVHDELHLNGTSDQPITIRPADNTSNWGAICLDNAAGASTLSNVVIKGAGTGRDWDTFSAAVSVMNSDITLDNVQFEDNAQSIFARGGSVTVRNCLFTETNNNEHINIVEADALVENCTFQNIIMGDAIDFDGITNGIIRNNKILGTMDSDGDGIDIGDDCSGVLITNNVIFDCADKGISVGEGAKDIKIERNVIAGCLYGIAVKDSANAFIDHNTLYNNDIAVAAYEKGVERFGGGTAVITNSILSKSGISTLYTDELSSITVSYTLADTELLPGEGNIQADPEFVSPLYRDFNLLSVSPAIDAGDPQSVLDPDETRSDMGMKFSQEADINIVINEINYNSSGDFNPDDWLELYNPNNEEIDLSGWVLKDEDDTHVFVLPINTVISGGEYFVLCRDAAAFHGMFPDVNKYAGDFGFGFNAAGELVRLYNSQGALVDYLAYDDETPWPLSPDGNGPTLSLINPDLDNEVPVNWGISHDHGTPGTENETITGVDETIFPNAFSLGQNYPNPFNPTTTITFSVPKKSFSELVIYNIMGQKVRTLISGELTPGNHSAAWDGRDDDGHAVSSGVYFSHLSIGEKVAARSMMLVK